MTDNHTPVTCHTSTEDDLGTYRTDYRDRPPMEKRSLTRTRVKWPAVPIFWGRRSVFPSTTTFRPAALLPGPNRPIGRHPTPSRQAWKGVPWQGGRAAPGRILGCATPLKYHGELRTPTSSAHRLPTHPDYAAYRLLNNPSDRPSHPSSSPSDPPKRLNATVIECSFAFHGIHCRLTVAIGASLF